MTRKNPAHLDNFRVSSNKDRVVVFDVSSDPVRGTHYYEIVSGKTEAEARERFYMSYTLRGPQEREMIDNAQRRNSLHIIRIAANRMIPIESNAQLIFYGVAA